MRNILSIIRQHEDDIFKFLEIAQSNIVLPTRSLKPCGILEPHRVALVQSRCFLIISELWRWASEVVGEERDVCPQIEEAFNLAKKGLLSDAASKLHEAAYELMHEAEPSCLPLQDVASVSELFIELLHLAALVTAESISDYWNKIQERLDLDKVLKISGGFDAISSLGRMLSGLCDWLDEAVGSSCYPIWCEIESPLPMSIVCWAAIHGHLVAISDPTQSQLPVPKRDAAQQPETSETVKLIN